MEPLSELGDGKYLLVRTFKRDGTAVATPVWVLRDGDRLVFWTAAVAGKVKRIRNNPRVEVAACDIRGVPSGPMHPGTARILPKGEAGDSLAKIRKKYGLVGWITMIGSRLRRGADGSAAIAVTPDQVPDRA